MHEIRVIAMSGAFSGGKVPLRVVADTYFQKDNDFGALLTILTSLPRPDRIAEQSAAAPAPVWISRYERDAAGEGFALIECSEGLKTFPKFLNASINLAGEMDCLYCGYSLHYAILPPDDESFLSLSQRAHSS